MKKKKNEATTVKLAAISFSCVSFDVGGNVSFPFSTVQVLFLSFGGESLFRLLLFAVDVQCALGKCTAKMNH